MKQYLIILSLAVFAWNAIGQQKTQVAIANNGLFIKSCERVATNMKSCVLCEDKELKKNCKTYTCDDAGQCAIINLGSNTLKSILQIKNIQNIKGIQKEKLGPETDYFIQNGNERTYYNLVNDVVKIENYTLRKEDPKTKSISRKSQGISPVKQNCIDDCVKVALECKNRCDGNVICWQGCRDSYMVCGRNCWGMDIKSKISISLKSGSTNTMQLLNQ